MKRIVVKLSGMPFDPTYDLPRAARRGQGYAAARWELDRWHLTGTLGTTDRREMS
jgi:hypothetical protein